jgi:hypothetical protein
MTLMYIVVLLKICAHTVTSCFGGETFIPRGEALLSMSSMSMFDACCIPPGKVLP